MATPQQTPSAHNEEENDGPQRHEEVPLVTVDPFRLVRKGTFREVGNQAIWTLSSCKPGKLLQELWMFKLVILL